MMSLDLDMFIKNLKIYYFHTQLNMDRKNSLWGYYRCYL